MRQWSHIWDIFHSLFCKSPSIMLCLWLKWRKFEDFYFKVNIWLMILSGLILSWLPNHFKQSTVLWFCHFLLLFYLFSFILPLLLARFYSYFLIFNVIIDLFLLFLIFYFFLTKSYLYYFFIIYMFQFLFCFILWLIFILLFAAVSYLELPCRQQMLNYFFCVSHDKMYSDVQWQYRVKLCVIKFWGNVHSETPSVMYCWVFWRVNVHLNPHLNETDFRTLSTVAVQVPSGDTNREKRRATSATRFLAFLNKTLQRPR